MIVHPKIDRIHDGPFIFAHLMGFSCSVCAPTSMTKDQVEAFALAEITPTTDGIWRSVDKSQMALGQPTPHQCNIEPDERTHWFLVIDK